MISAVAAVDIGIGTDGFLLFVAAFGGETVICLSLSTALTHLVPTPIDLFLPAGLIGIAFVACTLYSLLYYFMNIRTGRRIYGY